MTDPTPQQVAIIDQLNAATTDVQAFIYGLSTEDLLAELRCTVGRMAEHAAAEHAMLSPEYLTLSAVITGLSRFDLDGGQLDPSSLWQPVPQAVKGADDCMCHRDEHGGIRGRITRIHELGHQLHDDAGFGG